MSQEALDTFIKWSPVPVWGLWFYGLATDASEAVLPVQIMLLSAQVGALAVYKVKT